ncbi:MAG: DNA-3-methyladenine glycosylase [Anaerolineae bacterium]|nr:DNA-3-methyladenine glycosylase [Anaerolineae bacterium]
MRITLKVGEPLWRQVGQRTLRLDLIEENATVAGVLRDLEARYPAFGTLLWGTGPRPDSPPYNLFVNNHLVRWEAAATTPLHDGDTLYIFLPIVGGMGDGERLPRSFYARPTVDVARALLGQRLVRVLDGERMAGRIVEVEAYVGRDDLASHAARGRTARNAVMYGPPGYAYVYFIYGMHYCLNVVTEAEGFPAEVLIRAVEPLEGLAQMQARRGRPDAELTRGPGRLCQALAITRALNGADLCEGETLFIEADAPIPDAEVAATPRIGVHGDERALTVPWRFLVRGNGYVSRGG